MKDTSTTVFISRDLKSDSIFRTTLAKYGFTILDCSLLDFQPIVFSSIPETDWIFFYSPKAVLFFFQQLSSPLSHQKIAAFGEGTAKVLKQYVPTIDFIGTGNGKTTYLDFLALARGKKVLFPQAKQSRQTLEKLLIDQDITTISLVVYDNFAKAKFPPFNANFLVFTSPLNAKTYFSKYTKLPSQQLIAIGHSTSNTLKSLGFEKVIIANIPSELGMAEAVLENLEMT